MPQSLHCNSLKPGRTDACYRCMTLTLVITGLPSLLLFLGGAKMVADNENHIAAGCFAVELWIMRVGLMLK